MRLQLRPMGRDELLVLQRGNYPHYSKIGIEKPGKVLLLGHYGSSISEINRYLNRTTLRTEEWDVDNRMRRRHETHVDRLIESTNYVSHAITFGSQNAQKLAILNCESTDAAQRAPPSFGNLDLAESIRLGPL